MAKKLVIFAGNNTLWSGDPPRARPGSFETIMGLRCERTLLLSGDPVSQAEVVRKVGMEQHFLSRWFCGDPDTKKDILRQLLREAVRELKADAKDVVCVGDDPQGELLFASRLNMTTVFIPAEETRHRRFEMYQPDHRLADIRDLLTLV